MRRCALFGGQYSCSSITSISLSDSASSYSAALPGSILSCRKRSGGYSYSSINLACIQYVPACTCGCACYTYLHQWAWMPVCVSTTDTQAGVKSSSDKLIISSLEERWLTEREAVNQQLPLEQKPRNYSQPRRDQGGFLLKKATWISSSAWFSDHIFFPLFMCIRPIYKNNCDWKKSSRHVAFIDQSGRGILMHMNKFHFPEIVDIRSRLSCFALLCLAQNRLFWCKLLCWVHQYTHADHFIAWIRGTERLKWLFKTYYVT